MSKKNNVNPDHYKTAGRERQGEDIIHEVYKRRYTQAKSQTGFREMNFIPGAREEENLTEDELEMIAETKRRIYGDYRKGA